MNGYQIYERFCNELQRIGKTKKDFSDATGFSQGALTNWKNRGTMPSSELVVLISDYLGCSTDYVLGRSDVFKNEEAGPVFAPDESKLIDAWRDADDLEKRMITEMLAFINNKKNKKAD